jgi:drug/metabolite transporter (DMT)-like permease
VDSNHGPATVARSAAQVLMAAVLYGATGLFAKWIEAGPVVLTAGRFVVAAAALAAWWGVSRAGRVPARDLGPMAVQGLCLAANGVFFFWAVQTSTVAVAVLALFTYPLITALLEPWCGHERWSGPDVVGGVLVLAGVVLLVPRFSWDEAAARGAFFGVLSALTFALRNVLWPQVRRRHRPQVQGTVEFGAGALAVGLLAAGRGEALPGATDSALIALLGVGFTALPLWLFTASLRTFSASFASLLLSLQPVVGVVLAWLVLGEALTARTLAGASAIVGAVLFASAWRWRQGAPAPRVIAPR